MVKVRETDPPAGKSPRFKAGKSVWTGWGSEETLPVTPDWLVQVTWVPAWMVRSDGTKPEGVRRAVGAGAVVELYPVFSARKK